MRVIIAAIGLSLIVCVFADLNIGKREAGDINVVSERLYRRSVPYLPGVAVSKFYNRNFIITSIRATNQDGSNAEIYNMGGGVNTNKVLIIAKSPVGAGLNVQVDVYAKLVKSSAAITSNLDNSSDEEFQL